MINPADGSIVASTDLAGPQDVDTAVAAAKAAHADWSRATPGERAAALNSLAAAMSERAEEYAQVETAQAGKPIKLTREFDVPGSIDNVSFYAGAARNLEGKAAAEYDGLHTSMLRREPIGVVGSIAPWNYPLQMAIWKVLPAIAAGNTIVLKPAEITPLTSLMLAEDCTRAGIPDGVVNVLTGAGRVVGEALLTHPDVRMSSFTGSTPVGMRVMELASKTVKRVHLELGGKAPFVVFDDADLEAAVQGAVAGSLINSGQDCTAATRAYVQRPLYDAFVQGVADVMRTVRLGDPRDPSTDQGPLVSLRQRDSVAGYVDRARGYGAKIVVGGHAPGRRPREGRLLRADARHRTSPRTPRSSRRSCSGRCSSCCRSTPTTRASRSPTTPRSASPPRPGPATSCARCARAARSRPAACGSTTTSRSSSDMPHGGYKASGFGKDMSQYSFDEYTQVKHVSIDITGDARKDWHRTIFGDR